MMGARTKTPEGTPNEVKLATAIINHKTKIIAQGLAIAELSSKYDALQAHTATLTATSINAARNASSAPRWYRPWMGGIAMGLLLVVLFSMTISAKREAARANAWTAKADSQCNNTRRILDSLHKAREQDPEVVAPVRSIKRRANTATYDNDPLGIRTDAGAAPNTSTAPADVSNNTPVPGGN